MVGQNNLIARLKSFSIENFPHTTLFLGDKGCGKHTIVSTIVAPHLKLDVINITEYISFEYILEIQLRAIPAIYLIDMSSLNDRQQNIILKFIEEPLSNSFIILLSETKESLLDTIINRCSVFTFEPYTKEQLVSFMDNKNERLQELTLRVCTTPGQVIETGPDKIKDMFELSQKIVDKISESNYPNALSIAQRVNYKDEYDKFDVNVLFNVLITVLFDSYVIDNNQLSLKLYYKAVEYKNKLRNQRLNREIIVESFLTSIWKIARS